MSKGKRSKPQQRVFAGDGVPIKKDEINKNDVLLGRGHGVNRTPGNIRFRKIADGYKAQFLVGTDLDKQILAAKIVAKIRNDEPPGRFLELENNAYKEAGDKAAWESECAVPMIIFFHSYSLTNSHLCLQKLR